MSCRSVSSASTLQIGTSQAAGPRAIDRAALVCRRRLTIGANAGCPQGCPQVNTPGYNYLSREDPVTARPNSDTRRPPFKRFAQITSCPVHRRARQSRFDCCTRRFDVPLLVVPLGAARRAVLGALGGGGSILTVPALVHLLGGDPRTATTSHCSSSASHRSSPSGNTRVPVECGSGREPRSGCLAPLISLVPPCPHRSRRTCCSCSSRDSCSSSSTLMLRRAPCSVRHPNDLLDPPNEPPPDRPFSCASAPAWPGSWGQHPLSVYRRDSCVGGGSCSCRLSLALLYSMPTAVGTSLLVIAVNSATALAARLATSPAGATDLDWPLITTLRRLPLWGAWLADARCANPCHLTASFAVLMIGVASTPRRGLPLVQ